MADIYKGILQQLIQENGVEKLIELYPKTLAELVVFEDGSTTTVKEKINEIVQQLGAINEGVVTSVNGEKGAVSITPAKLGVYTKDESNDLHENLQNSINFVQQSANDAYELAEDAMNKAKGRATGWVFNTYDDMVEALEQAGADEIYGLGDSLFIVDTNVPDYWIKAKYEGKGDGEFSWFDIAELESQSVNLAQYQKITLTTSIEGATTVEAALAKIRDIAKQGVSNAATAQETANTALGNANTALEGVTGLTNGTTKAKKAEATDKLTNPRTIAITGAVNGSIAFDGSKDVEIVVTLANNSVTDDKLTTSGVTAGSYSVVSVNTKGRVVSGAQIFEVGTNVGAEPSTSLAVGGLFFKRIS